jgi:beta-lactamase regulating signal transducer with metallopeptidase domain
MTAPGGLQSLTDLALRFLPLLLASSLKASVIFAIVFLAAKLMHGVHPRLRHLLWLAAISSYLLVLALSAAGPTVLFASRMSPAHSRGMVGAVSSVLLPASGGLLSPGSAASSASGTLWFPPLASGWAAVWPLAALATWMGGALASFSRILVGRFQLHRFLSRSSPGGLHRCERLTRELAAGIGIWRRVRVVENPACRAPFTSRFLRPIIVLPSAMRSWSNGSLGAVLLHELRHIRRADCLTQTMAHAVCSFFWFVPFAWIACARLYLEQEKACDAGVVETGVRRLAYASCILDAARLCRQPATVAGLFFSGQRRRILADRIHSIIRGGKSMKKGWAVLVLAALVVFSLVFLSAAGQKELSDTEVWSRFVGEWVNDDYQSEFLPNKEVFRPDYSVEEWFTTGSAHANNVWTVELKKRWTDGAGRTYCQLDYRCSGGAWGNDYGVGLLRVDRARKVLELNLISEILEDFEYPETIVTEFVGKGEPMHGQYGIYYRK